jgi:hypothetical protein
MTIASLIVDVAANTVKLQQDVGKIHTQLDNVGAMASKVGTMLAGAFTVTAITAGIARIADYAGKLTDLAAKTGLTTTTLQQMERAAAVTGTSLDVFANAAFKLGVNISGGSNSVVSALDRLGLSYSQLRQQSPDQQFNTIARALSEVENAQDRNKLAVELFGKTAREILPAIASGYGDIADAAFTAGDDQIRAIDQASDALDGFLSDLKNVSVQLAGGFVIAVRESIKWINEKSAAIQLVRRGLDEWATALEFVGLKSQELPKVLNASSTQAKLLPPALRPIELSLNEIKEAEQRLTEQVKVRIEENKKAIKAQNDLIESQKRFRDSVTNLNTVKFGYMVAFKESIQEANFELQEMISNVPLAAQSFVPFKAAVEESSMAVESMGSRIGNFFGDLMRNTSKTLGELQETLSGKLTEIFGGGGMMSNIISGGLNLVFGPASGIIATLVGKGMAWMAETVWHGLQKIGGFFRDLFGGPSADELAGRELVKKFEDNLHAMLNEQQRLEAGNESWKMTVIAIRDAYIAKGLSAAEAMAAAERLWASSRSGAAASAQAIAEIERILNGTASAAANLGAQIDSATRPRTIDIHYNAGDAPDSSPGFAVGSGGIRNFGSGTPVVLHGKERVQTESQMKAEQAGMSQELLIELKALRRELPSALQLAVQTGMALA